MMDEKLFLKVVLGCKNFHEKVICNSVQEMVYMYILSEESEKEKNQKEKIPLPKTGLLPSFPLFFLPSFLFSLPPFLSSFLSNFFYFTRTQKLFIGILRFWRLFSNPCYYCYNMCDFFSILAWLCWFHGILLKG
jgi:hypothetical protein